MNKHTVIHVTGLNDNTSYLIPINSINYMQEKYNHETNETVTKIFLTESSAERWTILIQESLSEIYKMIKGDEYEET